MIQAVKKWFDISEKEIKKMAKTIAKINELEKQIGSLSDEHLQSKTEEFKKRIEQGASLDSLLPEAYAVVREASKRILGMRHYDVQLMGGIALHKGNIAEMRTGEGKTLVSTLPVYLNALNGRGVHVITVNEYLAQRDSSEMGKLHEFLGLSVGLITNSLSPQEKQLAYACDITYGTNNEFGFDYLRDNMVIHKEEKVQRGLVFAIIDEVDSVLIDEARTPLIISGQTDASTSLYTKADHIVRTLKETTHYSYDEKTKQVTLTEEGLTKTEKSFGIENLFDMSNIELNHHINQALKAHVVMKKDNDYVVHEDQIIIVDQFTGRMMEGRRFSDGLHQAIEAKEQVDIQNESRTLATVTFQNYFRMYEKLAGMTGTGKTEAEEFREIYNMHVLEIPTNRPVLRIDKADVIYKSEEEKFDAIILTIQEAHQKGQPVLVGTASIESSELLSEKLATVHVPHYVLNAKHHEKEAEIIAQAGNRGSVTIATNMAGRGTDIKLEEGVNDLGGLLVIGSERHESRRIDYQLRGRSGRQGDPGTSIFFLSLEDELMRRFGGENLKNLMEKLGIEKGEAIESRMVSKAIESAQKRVEGNNFDARKSVLKYDDVLREQREIIYKQRDEVLDSESLKPLVISMINTTIQRIVDRHTFEDRPEEEWEYEAIVSYMNTELFKGDEIKKEDVWLKEKEEILSFLHQKASEKYAQKEQLFGEYIREVERAIVLRGIDRRWMEHIDAMHELRQGIHLRSYAQTDPLREYQFEGFDMFEAMIEAIEEEVAILLMKADISEPVERFKVAQTDPPSLESFKTSLKLIKRK